MMSSAMHDDDCSTQHLAEEQDMASFIVLDGCALTRECLAILLRNDGHKVHAVATIAQAKTLISKRQPDLLLCELVLPDGNVVGLLRWMKESAKSVRACVLTNVAAKLPLTKAVEAGVAGVLLKSKFTYEGLLKQIDDLCGQSSTSAQDTPPTLEQVVRHPLPIPSPDPTLELRTIKPLHSRTTMEQALDEHGTLSVNAVVVDRVRSILQGDACEMESLAGAVSGDPGLVSHVLRAATKEDDGHEEPVSSVFDALLRIGLERLENILDQISSNTAHGRTDATLSHIHLCAHSVAVSEIASRIAPIMNIDEKRARLAGLIHDVGRFRMLDSFADQVHEVVDVCTNLGIPMHLGEKRMLLSTHDSLGASSASGWNLPKEVLQAIANHHEEPGRIATQCPGFSAFVLATALANTIAHALGFGYSGTTTIESGESYIDQIESESFRLNPVLEGLEDAIHASLAHAGFTPDMLNALVPHVVPDLPMQPAYITMDPENDLIGHWVQNEFGDLSPNAQTNITIVHARFARDRAELSAKLETLDAALLKEGVTTPVPVLILSPNGKTGLTEDLMTRHLCMHLRTPFGVSMFERACNALLSGKQQIEAQPIELKTAA